MIQVFRRNNKRIRLDVTDGVIPSGSKIEHAIINPYKDINDVFVTEISAATNTHTVELTTSDTNLMPSHEILPLKYFLEIKLTTPTDDVTVLREELYVKEASL